MRNDQDHGAFASATVRQSRGSRLRLVHFRSGDLVYDRDDQLVLSMGLTANHSLEYETGGCRVRVVPIIGRFGLMTPGSRFDIRLHGDCTVVQMVLPRDVLEGWLGEDHGIDGRRVEVIGGHSLDDPVVSKLLLAALADGVQNENVALRKLAFRLLERHSSGPRPGAPAGGGLPPHKLRRIIEMIEDDPARAIGLDEFAREVSLSPYHFAHQFERTTGRPPHRFLVERRLSRAVQLLCDGRWAIAEIAAKCGFTHSSHLGRHLKRVLGLSPLEVRRALVGR